jgi:broad specificity phosphatase PhoE
LDLAVETDERLIEIGHGTWEGRYREELARNDAERYRLWREDPARVSFENGETLPEVAARWDAFAASVLARPDEELLVVTHDAVVRVALLALEARPLDDFWQMPVENAAFARIERTDGRLHLVEACHTEHLADLRAPVGGQAL